MLYIHVFSVRHGKTVFITGAEQCEAINESV